MTLCIGVDLDNTILRYDVVFHRVALEQGLIPATLAVTKEAVRDHLRAIGREDEWTLLQGEVYGRRLREAEAFPGALETMGAWVREGIPVWIISHKTRHPYRGPAWDLHAAALDWLDFVGVFSPAGVGLSRSRVSFSETKEGKLAAIAEAGCTHFLDDLPEILRAPAFPASTRRLWFGGDGARGGDLCSLPTWGAVAGFMAGERP
ncbi:MAG: haloacid dehalogenase-like hydrolase [Acidobacteria bacterium]|nr:haloacid dehalogenase-like hydrolase [Acidobacteriota bacterium]